MSKRVASRDPDRQQLHPPAKTPSELFSFFDHLHLESILRLTLDRRVRSLFNLTPRRTRLQAPLSKPLASHSSQYKAPFAMAISDQVRSQLFQSTKSPSTISADAKAIRIPTTRGGATRGGLVPRSLSSGRGLWTPEEHLRFLEALDKFPSGPWKCIAEYVGNKTARQAMTHGQKYRQKIARRRRGLKKIVRDLQFAAVEVQDDNNEEEEENVMRLSVESNPMALSDQDFEAFISSLDLAEELQLDVMNTSHNNESPLVVPNAVTTYEQDIARFSLGELEVEVPEHPASVTSDCGLPQTTTQQDVHHWVVMDRADASSEEFSTALAAAFQSGYAEAETYVYARPLPLPEQLLDEYVQEQKSLAPLVAADPALEDLESFELDGFALR